jgi:uncharacterized phage protein (TIGR01671 family)
MKYSGDIKFRGFWQTVKGEWQSVIGNLSIVDNKEHSGYFISNKYGSPFAYQVIPSTVEQFTGLKDKNGIEIFGQDIVKLPNKIYEMFREVDWKGKNNGIYEIYWNNETASFHGRINKLETGLYVWLIAKESEVIGNTIENKELLK